MERLLDLQIQAKNIAEMMSNPKINPNYLKDLTEVKVKVANEIRELQMKYKIN